MLVEHPDGLRMVMAAIDDALLDMLRGYRDDLVAWLKTQGQTIDDIESWDTFQPDRLDAVLATKAVGFILGFAAALDLTPLEALDLLYVPPPCVAEMRCLCAAHARGRDASEPCDATERPLLLATAPPTPLKRAAPKKKSRQRQRIKKVR
jgi:hypothetical protein